MVLLPVWVVLSWILSTVTYGNSAVSGDTRPAVRPPVDEMNSQWSTLEMTLIKNGAILSTLRIA